MSAEPHRFDEQFSTWGPSPYYTLALEAEIPLRELLSHLYVLVPVLDDHKHYWVSEEEVDKLLRYSESWLAGHSARELIVDRYLRYR